jgi:hypothetical protein
MYHKTTHHSMDRLGCVPLMFLSNPIIIMGNLKYHLDYDVYHLDCVYYHVNDNFILVLNFKTNLISIRVIKCRKREDKDLQ